MHLSGKNLAFVLANTAAVIVALYIAFASDLERPYWALFTVFIVAKPITGAVRSKAVFRFLGTVAGAALALLLVPPLVHAPVLLCLAISLWVGLCLYLSLQDRRPRSYAFLLAATPPPSSGSPWSIRHTRSSTSLDQAGSGEFRRGGARCAS
jgi:uncharacterized membrane protein YccC